MLSPKTVQIVKATVPALEAHGLALTTHFYKKMFAGNPEVKEFFNPAHNRSGAQPAALAGAVLAYAKNIDNLGVLGDAVELIAQKHVSLMVKAEHYPIVGKHLLAAIKDVMGDAATPDVINAWAEAYGVLADVLIKREGQIYSEQPAKAGWTGVKEFVLAKREAEGDYVTSIWLRPKDGMKLRPFQAGQFLTVRVPGTWWPTTLRNYSISCAPGDDMYRISVQHHLASGEAPAGAVSTYLCNKMKIGDTLEVLPPCGNFTVDACGKGQPPIVLCAGGIGVSPLLSIAHSALTKQSHRDVYFLYGVKSKAHLAYHKELKQLKSKHKEKFHMYLCANEVEKSKEFNGEGNLDAAKVKHFVPSKDAEFFLCGPSPFLKDMHKGLREWGVDQKRIHYEFLGPLEPIPPPSKLAAAS